MDYNIHTREIDGKWQYIISYKVGKSWPTKSKRGFDTQDKAYKAAIKRLPEIEELAERSAPVGSDKITLSKFLDIYIEDKKLHRGYVTIVNFKISINKFTRILNKPLCKITNKDIQQCINDMIYEGLKATTIKAHFNKLKTLLKCAHEEYEYIPKLIRYKIEIPKDDPESKIALTSDEIHKILNEFKDSSYYIILCICVYTGLRAGEIMGLCWDDIDFKNNNIKIHRQWKQDKTGKYDFGTLKSKNSYRDIPLNPILKDILIQFKSVGRITHLSNTKSMCVNINDKLSKYNISLHELRHTFCTNLISNGLDFKSVSYIMGHNVRMTMDIYSHYNNDMHDKAAKVISNIFK